MIGAAVNVLTLVLLVAVGVAANALRDELASLHSRLDALERRQGERRLRGVA